MSSIGENIERLRKEHGLSQDELAKLVGKTRAAISQYEHNETTPRMGVIERMAEVFGVQKSEIIETRIEYSSVQFLSEDEEELIRLFRAVPPQARRAILSGLRDYSE